MNSPADRQAKLRTIVVCLMLAVGTATLFWPVLNFEFIGYDDPFYITTNSHIQGGFTWAGVAWAFGKITSGFTYWHPVAWMSHMFDCELFGLNPAGHHLMNAAFHLMNAIVLLLVLQQLTQRFWPAVAVAAVFACHPLQVETVAWVTERKNLISTLFLLLTLSAYAGHVRESEASKQNSQIETGSGFCCHVCPLLHSNLYLLSLAFFALGLMSKAPALVTVPGLLLLVDFWPLTRVSIEDWQNREARPDFWKKIKALAFEKLPFLFMSVISAAIVVISHKEFESLASGQMSFGIRFVNALYSYVRYLKKTFWPSDLAPIYPFPTTWPVSRVLVCVAILCAITALAISTARKRPYFLFGWFWFVGTLIPLIGLVQAGAQAMADRFVYMPLIGVLVALVWGMDDLLAKWRFREAINMAVMLSVVAACGIVTQRQLQFWRNSVTLFERALAIEPVSPIAEYNLGYAFAMRGDTAHAKIHFLKAIEISHDYVDAHNNLAALLLAEGKMDQAISRYREALKANPRHPLANFNLGVVFVHQNKLDEALKYYAAAVEAQPDNPEFRLAHATTLGSMGRGMEATAEVLAIVKDFPNSAEANLQAGNVMMMSQRLPEAITFYATAIRLKPQQGQTHYHLGTALAMSGKVHEALPHFAEAVRLDPGMPEGRLSLGIALAQTGNAEEARKQYHEGMRLATAAGRKDVADRIQAQLAEMEKQAPH